MDKTIGSKIMKNALEAWLEELEGTRALLIESVTEKRKIDRVDKLINECRKQIAEYEYLLNK